MTVYLVKFTLYQKKSSVNCRIGVQEGFILHSQNRSGDELTFSCLWLRRWFERVPPEAGSPAWRGYAGFLQQQDKEREKPAPPAESLLLL